MAAGESGGLGGQGSTTGIWRAIDASANRAGEALRVLEDVLRFGLDDEHLTRLAKDLRHDLAGALVRHGLGRRTAARDVIGDVGAGLEAEAALSRSGLADLIAANAARAAQALRSLQECAAVVATEATAGFESIRYRVYTLERAATTAVRASDRLADVSLCVLVDGGQIDGAKAPDAISNCRQFFPAGVFTRVWGQRLNDALQRMPTLRQSLGLFLRAHLQGTLFESGLFHDPLAFGRLFLQRATMFLVAPQLLVDFFESLASCFQRLIARDPRGQCGVEFDAQRSLRRDRLRSAFRQRFAA